MTIADQYEFNLLELPVNQTPDRDNRFALGTVVSGQLDGKEDVYSFDG